MAKDPHEHDGGLGQLSSTLKRASANIAAQGTSMADKAKDALGIVEPIPAGVYYDPEEIRFFMQDPDNEALIDIMSAEFFEKWHSRWEEFPQLELPATFALPVESGEQVDSTIPPVVDAEALAAEVYDFSHLGPPNEFTVRRTERLREDMEEIRSEVAKIDAEIIHLNARRTNAMLAYSGISADLQAMEK